MPYTTSKKLCDELKAKIGDPLSVKLSVIARGHRRLKYFDDLGILKFETHNIRLFLKRFSDEARRMAVFLFAPLSSIGKRSIEEGMNLAADLNAIPMTEWEATERDQSYHELLGKLRLAMSERNIEWTQDWQRLFCSGPSPFQAEIGTPLYTFENYFRSLDTVVTQPNDSQDTQQITLAYTEVDLLKAARRGIQVVVPRSSELSKKAVEDTFGQASQSIMGIVNDAGANQYVSVQVIQRGKDDEAKAKRMEKPAARKKNEGAEQAGKSKKRKRSGGARFVPPTELWSWKAVEKAFADDRTFKGGRPVINLLNLSLPCSLGQCGIDCLSKYDLLSRPQASRKPLERGVNLNGEYTRAFRLLGTKGAGSWLHMDHGPATWVQNLDGAMDWYLLLSPLSSLSYADIKRLILQGSDDPTGFEANWIKIRLERGDILFMQAGTLHAVRKLKDTHSSAGFVALPEQIPKTLATILFLEENRHLTNDNPPVQLLKAIFSHLQILVNQYRNAAFKDMRELHDLLTALMAFESHRVPDADDNEYKWDGREEWCESWKQSKEEIQKNQYIKILQKIIEDNR